MNGYFLPEVNTETHLFYLIISLPFSFICFVWIQYHYADQTLSIRLTDTQNFEFQVIKNI